SSWCSSSKNWTLEGKASLEAAISCISEISDQPNPAHFVCYESDPSAHFVDYSARCDSSDLHLIFSEAQCSPFYPFLFSSDVVFALRVRLQSHPTDLPFHH